MNRAKKFLQKHEAIAQGKGLIKFESLGAGVSLIVVTATQSDSTEATLRISKPGRVIYASTKPGVTKEENQKLQRKIFDSLLKEMEKFDKSVIKIMKKNGMKKVKEITRENKDAS